MQAQYRVTDHISLSRCGVTVSSNESTAGVYLWKLMICPKLLIKYSYISFQKWKSGKLWYHLERMSLVVESLKKVLENGLFKASLRKSPLFSRLWWDRDRRKMACTGLMSEINSLQNSNTGWRMIVSYKGNNMLCTVVSWVGIYHVTFLQKRQWTIPCLLGKEQEEKCMK